jgi:hypothetical protein
MRGFPFAPSDNSDNLTQVPERGVPRLLLVGALVYAAAHLPFLAQSLEDIDSINFALGLRHYDISQHQPHPPGYPVYIAIARVVLGAVHLVHAGAQPAAAEALALALVSAVSGALAVVCLGMIFAAFDRMSAAPARRFWWWATALAAGSPLFWISGLRPMSDLPGLSLALLSLALMLCSGSRVSFLAGALVAGLSAGVRVQTALLTVPTMALLVWARRMRARDALEAVAALGAGGLLWAVPLLWLSGGVDGYLAALGSQAGEDFAWVEMLWANPTPRRLALALTDSFLRPWSSNGVAATVLALAAIGFVVEVLTRGRALLFVTVAFAPYALFHLLLQETSHVRYALPLLPPVAWLASRALMQVGRLGSAFAFVIVAACLVDAVPTSVVYARQRHPAFRVIADMAREAEGAPPGAVFSHYALYRSLQAAAPRRLPVVAPVRNKEWMGPLDYFRRGERATVWFLADPRRTDLDLMDRRTLQKAEGYPWDVAGRPEFGGARPVGAEWYRLSPPDWVVGEGWSLTPEAGGRVSADRSGLIRGPIEAVVRRQPEPLVAVIGGWYLGNPAGPATAFTLEIDGATVETWTHDHRSAGSGFLHVVRLAEGIPAGDGAYASLRLTARSPVGGRAGEVAIRQFDIHRESGSMLAFGPGWHEDEYNPTTGLRWRWSSDRSDLFVVAGSDTTLVLRGESPLKYFGEPPIVRVTTGAITLGEFRPDADFEWRIPIPRGTMPRGGGNVTVSLDRAYLPGPAEGTSDTRRLGLRIFGASLEGDRSSIR